MKFLRRKGSARPRSAGTGVVIGEDWVAPEETVDATLRTLRSKRGVVVLNRSPLARKIITFNLLAMVVLVAGILYLNPFRESLVLQREAGLIAEAKLLAQVIEMQVGGTDAAPAEVDEAGAVLARLARPATTDIFVFDLQGALVASTLGQPRPTPETIEALRVDNRSTMLTDFLDHVWGGLSRLFGAAPPPVRQIAPQDLLRPLLPATLAGKPQVSSDCKMCETPVFAVAAPILRNGAVIGAIGLSDEALEIEQLVQVEREQVLQVFVIAVIVSIGLSLVLASTIANPLSELAAAAEIGRDRNSRMVAPGRVRIPDLTARPDEIGRLSDALRGMVTALYDRIDANEQFAADVAHEIKNPLASLRSAVSSLRISPREDHRLKLLDIIEHDVRRLDRLVSDIANASRLDSELVKEQEESFDLTVMLGNLSGYLGSQARDRGIEFITDVPPGPIQIQGLEARLAQVFVNLITNAISFCNKGDAVRVWVRKRENRVLVVVEDTGPGIPEQALAKIFKRFYSERPPGQFGEHSGLGLAISKQIVEAHGGVIWAENIRAVGADASSAPLGARFVVGLPV
ncbi:histidine kinase [Rhodobacter veldkampii DSM 11550]|uniref:histidine kinase n=1 Tax=Phaeovulum veldkampii DSM 11550 TaxID=1185920 RepID=A0A2T4JK44_9RHOB|nr:sensor histidine kinase [Phaeovulum veldkampii]MBK5946893.1 histidine kinase [Phaeovulum veldkampii DSM 11550]PTE18233.1 histidine kinase [Phaeovulum veldkampii DSM 11550]